MRLKQAVFLVGGRGTRLGEISAHTPKPLLEVGGRPFLDILIENAARFGVREVILLAGHLGEQVRTRYAQWGRDRGLDITSVIEPEQAGTAGALRHAASRLDESFFLGNGDSLFDVNLLDLAMVPAVPGWLGKMALRQVPNASRYGQVVLKDGRVEDMLERGHDAAGLVNGGVYVLRRDILARVGPNPCSIERDVFPVLAREGLLFGKEYDGFFLDIGIPDDFARAQRAVPEHLRRPAAFLDRDGVLNVNHGYVHKPEDFEWIEGAIAAIKHLNDSGWLVVVVTNQAGVARGYYDEAAIHALHDWMQNELARHGAHIDAFYYCPHHPEGAVAGYARACDCRKPAPGMLNAAMHDWSVDREHSFFIGDSDSDMAAARAAGIRGVPFPGGDLFSLVEGALG